MDLKNINCACRYTWEGQASSDWNQIPSQRKRERDIPIVPSSNGTLDSSEEL